MKWRQTWQWFRSISLSSDVSTSFFTSVIDSSPYCYSSEKGGFHEHLSSHPVWPNLMVGHMFSSS